VSCCKRFIGTVPKPKNREHQWWGYIKSKLPAITQAGFTALWLPPANKAAWWKSTGYDPYDYFNQSGVDALIKVHEQNAAGPTQVLYVNDDLYVMQRLGDGDQSGPILVLNNRGTWNGTWVQNTMEQRAARPPQPGADTMILACRKKNGLTSPAGSFPGCLPRW
jgi:hypothetical protein